MTGVLAILVGSGGVRATAAPDFANGFGTGFVSTGSVSVTVVGGTAPFLYSWALTGGDAGILPFNPGGQTTAFFCDGVSVDDILTANYVCTVTDAGGATGETNAVTVNITGI